MRRSTTAVLGCLICVFAIAVQGKDTVVPWMDLPPTPYTPLNITVGDTVTFTWSDDGHGVAEVPTGDCPTTWRENDGVKILAKEEMNGNYVWTATTPGTVWFACQVSDHCSSGGQIIQVNVA